MGNCYNKKFTRKSSQTFNDKQLTKRLNMSKSNISFKKKKRYQLRNKQEVLSQYKIQKQIGSGLFSKVYLAYNNEGKQIALKVVKKKEFIKKDSIHKILLEKEIMQMMNHDNILRLYRTIQSKSQIFFEMELADLGSLLTIMNSKTEWTYQEIQFIAAQIIEGLCYIHSKQIVYGDLKAENILLNSKGVIKICDFNLSGTASQLQNQFQGTAVYMAPELVKNSSKLYASDFWSLGVLIHLMCYRKFPFKRDTREQLFRNITRGRIIPENFNKQVEPALRQFILDLLILNPSKRLGQNFQDIMQHEFFKGFNWNEYRQSDMGERIVQEFKELHRIKMQKKQTQIQKMNTLLEESRTSFVYNISEFTFNEADEYDFNSQSTNSTEQYQLIKIVYIQETQNYNYESKGT